MTTGMEEIAERKECGAETGAGKIEVVTDAMFLAPTHGGETTEEPREYGRR